jgi:hypothetical protein
MRLKIFTHKLAIATILMLSIMPTQYAFAQAVNATVSGK